jgi:hypothetical protein
MPPRQLWHTRQDKLNLVWVLAMRLRSYAIARSMERGRLSSCLQEQMDKADIPYYFRDYCAHMCARYALMEKMADWQNTRMSQHATGALCELYVDSDAAKLSCDVTVFGRTGQVGGLQGVPHEQPRDVAAELPPRG